jgi:molybdopterin converting factor small subunit
MNHDPSDHASYRLLLFARAKELMQSEAIEVQSTATCQIAKFRNDVAKQYPQLESLLVSSRFAVNQTFATDTTLIHPDNEIALILPVSGG